MNTDLFPAKLAAGEQFCNRVEEQKALVSNIEKSRHTVLVSPRRYGKSSLVHQVVSQLDFGCASIDLFLAHDDKAVVKRLLTGISEELSQIMSISQKSLVLIDTLFSQFKTTMSVGTLEVGLAYDKGEVDAAYQVYSALTALDKLATQKKIKLIIFINEFQDISAAENAKSIQGAIRHIAQQTDHLVFIFSGSNRHLLLEMFDDKSMPLYMLCDKIQLDRMSSAHYHPHINQQAIKQWGKPLQDMVFSKIMTLTERHPFYVNLLCHQIWQGTYPGIEHIEICWQSCMEQETYRIRSELEKLSRNQQQVVQALAIESTAEPTGQAFSTRSGLAVSSLHQTIKTLFEKDVIYKVTHVDPTVPLLKLNHTRVLDPLIARYLKRYA